MKISQIQHKGNDETYLTDNARVIFMGFMFKSSIDDQVPLLHNDTRISNFTIILKIIIWMSTYKVFST